MQIHRFSEPRSRRRASVSSRRSLRLALVLAVVGGVGAAVVLGMSASSARAAVGSAWWTDFRPESEHVRPSIAPGSTQAWDATHNITPPTSPPTPPATPVVAAGGELATSFDGLNHFDQRYGADNGNQFSLEPPDQGLCVGGSNVVEAVNDVFAIYNRSGQQTSPTTSLTMFFTGKHQINRNDPNAHYNYGPFLSDPKCYYDPGTGRFFLTILQIDQNPITGVFTGGSSELIAVSKGTAPSTSTSDWYFYKIDTTNNGAAATDTGGAARTMPNHPGCPCYGDQPLIGADRYGFYITTNEFPITGPGFNGAQVYAFDKIGLESGTLRFQYVAGQTALPLAEGPAYSLQPATSPSPGDWDLANGGTEYLMSALDFNATLDNRIAVWALTNTQSLATSSPNVHLHNKVIESETYGQPVPADQKDGPHPFGEWGANHFYGGAPNQPVNSLNTNDDRMNQVVYAGHSLWGGVNTIINDSASGNLKAGIAWFNVRTFAQYGQVFASIGSQGYVAVPGQNVMFPSIGVTPQGHEAVMTMSMSGPDYYPSAVYSVLRGYRFRDVRIAGAGVGPADGFTGYDPFASDGVERWGDYSAAVGDLSGKIWIATEYINQSCTVAEYQADTTCGGTRSTLANWGTRVAAVNP